MYINKKKHEQFLHEKTKRLSCGFVIKVFFWKKGSGRKRTADKIFYLKRSNLSFLKKLNTDIAFPLKTFLLNFFFTSNYIWISKKMPIIWVQLVNALYSMSIPKVPWFYYIIFLYVQHAVGQSRALRWTLWTQLNSFSHSHVYIPNHRQ